MTKLTKKARVSRAKTAAEARWGNAPRFRKQVALSTTRPTGIADLWAAMVIRAKNRQQDIGELAFEILWDALEGTIEALKEIETQAIHDVEHGIG